MTDVPAEECQSKHVEGEVGGRVAGTAPCRDEDEPEHLEHEDHSQQDRHLDMVHDDRQPDGEQLPPPPGPVHPGAVGDLHGDAAESREHDQDEEGGPLPDDEDDDGEQGVDAEEVHRLDAQQGCDGFIEAEGRVQHHGAPDDAGHRIHHEKRGNDQGAHDVHAGKVLVQHEPEQDPQDRAGGKGDQRDQRRVQDDRVEITGDQDVEIVVQSDERDPEIGADDDPLHDGEPDGDQDGRLGDDRHDHDCRQGEEPGPRAVQFVHPLLH